MTTIMSAGCSIKIIVLVVLCLNSFMASDPGLTFRYYGVQNAVGYAGGVSLPLATVSVSGLQAPLALFNFSNIGIIDLVSFTFEQHSRKLTGK